MDDMDDEFHNEVYEDIPADEFERMLEEDALLLALDAGMAKIVTVLEARS